MKRNINLFHIFQLQFCPARIQFEVFRDLDYVKKVLSIDLSNTNKMQFRFISMKQIKDQKCCCSVQQHKKYSLLSTGIYYNPQTMFWLRRMETTRGVRGGRLKICLWSFESDVDCNHILYGVYDASSRLFGTNVGWCQLSTYFQRIQSDLHVQVFNETQFDNTKRMLMNCVFCWCLLQTTNGYSLFNSFIMFII